MEIYAPRGTDPQQPHTRDEVYFVASGSGEYVCGESRQSFKATDLLFATAGCHHFENFTAELTVWVLFMGPEGWRRCRKEMKYRGLALPHPCLPSDVGQLFAGMNNRWL